MILSLLVLSVANYGYSQEDSNLVFLSYSNINKQCEEDLRQFYNHFPKSFSQFYDYYGDSDKPLYYTGGAHVQIYRMCSGAIDSMAYVSSLISIGMGGRWDADAVSWMQKLIKDEFTERNRLFCSILEGYKNEEVVSFFIFYMDKLHFKDDDFPVELKALKDTYPSLYYCSILAKERLLIIYK